MLTLRTLVFLDDDRSCAILTVQVPLEAGDVVAMPGPLARGARTVVRLPELIVGALGDDAGDGSGMRSLDAHFSHFMTAACVVGLRDTPVGTVMPALVLDEPRKRGHVYGGRDERAIVAADGQIVLPDPAGLGESATRADHRASIDGVTFVSDLCVDAGVGRATHVRATALAVALVSELAPQPPGGAAGSSTQSAGDAPHTPSGFAKVDSSVTEVLEEAHRRVTDEARKAKPAGPRTYGSGSAGAAASAGDGVGDGGARGQEQGGTNATPGSGSAGAAASAGDGVGDGATPGGGDPPKRCRGRPKGSAAPQRCAQCRMKHYKKDGCPPG